MLETAPHDGVRVGSLGDRVAEVLRERIIRGELQEGARLVEGALAEQFDVSRGPVRDAFAILASQGLIVARRQGVVVKGLSNDDVEELYSLRMAIEDLALLRAIENTRGKPDAWNVAEGKVADLLRAASVGNLSAYAETDLAFHGEFYRLSRHARVQQVWEQLRPIFSVILKVTNELDAPDLQPSIADHERLLMLARSGEVAEARIGLEEHLKGSLRRIRLAMTSRSNAAKA